MVPATVPEQGTKVSHLHSSTTCTRSAAIGMVYGATPGRIFFCACKRIFFNHLRGPNITTYRRLPLAPLPWGILVPASSGRKRPPQGNRQGRDAPPQHCRNCHCTVSSIGQSWFFLYTVLPGGTTKYACITTLLRTSPRLTNCVG